MNYWVVFTQGAARGSDIKAALWNTWRAIATVSNIDAYDEELRAEAPAILVHLAHNTNPQAVFDQVTAGTSLRVGPRTFKIGAPTTIGQRSHSLTDRPSAAQELHKAALASRNTVGNRSDEFALVASTYACNASGMGLSETGEGRPLPVQPAIWQGRTAMHEATYTHPASRATVRIFHDRRTSSGTTKGWKEDWLRGPPPIEVTHIL